MAAGSAAAPAPASGNDLDFSSLHEKFDQSAGNGGPANSDLAFSTDANPFASVTSEWKTDDVWVFEFDALLFPSNTVCVHFWVGGLLGENGVGTTATDRNEVFNAFDDANNTAGAAGAFAGFDNAWGEVPPERGTKDRASSAPDGFGELDEADEKERATPRRTKSGKDGEKHRSNRRPRPKPGAEDSAEGLETSVDEINISEGDRKPRREGEKRPAGKSSGDRRRRPKESESEERSTPRRNRSNRESRTTEPS